MSLFPPDFLEILNLQYFFSSGIPKMTFKYSFFVPSPGKRIFRKSILVVQFFNLDNVSFNG